jgi:hypothetical protein
MRYVVAVSLALSLTAAAPGASAALVDLFEIRWAGESSQPAGSGAPDGNVFTQGDSSATTFSAFGAPTLNYAGLAAALGVDLATLADADVIAWEANGGSPAAGGGWESSVWTFEDSIGGSATAAFSQALTPVFIGNGTLSNAQYGALFGMVPAEAGVYSFLLMDADAVAGVDASLLTTVRLLGVGAPGQGLEGTPDPDAVGLLQPVPAPETWTLTAAGLLLLAGVLRTRRG